MNTDYNAIIRLDITNLASPLTTIKAMQLCGVKVKVTNAPPTAYAMRIVVFKADGTHFAAMPLTQDGNGDFEGFVIGTCFPNHGRTKYQIVYKNEDGRNCAGGRGDLLIEQFDPYAGGEPLPTGEIPICEISDKNGQMHHIVAVNVGTEEDPDWTSQVMD